MIQKLSTENFTALKEAHLEFADNLNVFIGENGTGKTHILKLLYAILSGYGECKCSPDGTYTRQTLQQAMARKLYNVFRPDQLGRLTTRKQGRARATIALQHRDARHNATFSFATNSKSEVNFSVWPQALNVPKPIYFPAKELLTLYPRFVAMYDEFYMQYDETYRDTMLLLGKSYLKGAHETRTKTWVTMLEEAIGGHIHLNRNGDSFYMQLQGDSDRAGDMEINLVAEGWRKMGMLTQVILNGALRNRGYLLWDEPEANMNSRLITTLANAIFTLSQELDIQVFITTHSLFLLRELEHLTRKSGHDRKTKYFALHADGTIDQSHDTADLREIVALSEEIRQAERILNERN